MRRIAVFLVLVLSACGSAGGNTCEQAKSRAQTCHDELCAEGAEGHSMCDEPLPTIDHCTGTAERAAQRLLESEDAECYRILNMYSNAHAFQE